MKKICNAIDVHVGQRVRITRIYRELTAEITARRLGLSVAGYNESELGERRFQARELQDLSQLLNVKAASFFGDLKAMQASISRAAIEPCALDDKTELTAEIIPMRVKPRIRAN